MADMLTELDRKLHHRQPRSAHRYDETLFYTHAVALRRATRMARADGVRRRVRRGPDPEGVADCPMWLITREVAEPCT